jgi:CheY-like chemotaxis protein
MSLIKILCIDDEPEILKKVKQELATFEEAFPITLAGSAEEARDLIPALTKNNDQIGVVLCSYILSGQNGIDFLIHIHTELGLSETRKVLLTKRAGLEETVRGLNKGNLNYYLAKPWGEDELRQVVRDQLTAYFIRTRQDPMPYIEHLDSMKIFDAIHKGFFKYED